MLRSQQRLLKGAPGVCGAPTATCSAAGRAASRLEDLQFRV